MNTKAFYDLGTKVKNPEQFVGRKEQLEYLLNDLPGNNVNIFGLPRIGKSSLAYQAIQQISTKWKASNQTPLITIWFDVSASSTPRDFFNGLLRLIHQEISSIIFNKDKEDELSCYKAATKGKVDTLSIIDYFKCIDGFNIEIILCLDEFDAVKYILKNKSECLGCFRSILDNSKHICSLVISRRTLTSIEKDICNRSNNSKLPGVFSTSISLKPFDDDEMALYWQRLKPYFDEKRIKLSEEYKKTAYWYCGHIPYFLDLFNDFYLQGKRNADDFIAMMNDIFHAMIVVLEEQNLLNAVIQIVIGPCYDFTHDNLDLLLRYGFLRKVSIADNELINHSNYYITENNERFVCFSDYFTNRLKQAYKSQAPFWPEWEKTLSLLKSLVLDYIIQNAGVDWENQNTGPFQGSMSIAKQKDIDAGIPVSESLADYLIEKDMICVILSSWNVFKNVFNMTTDDFDDKINKVLFIRNHHSHGNMNKIKEHQAYLDSITSLCVELSNMIEKWNTSGSGSLIDITLSNLPYNGIVEKDTNGIYHIGPFLISKSIVEKNNWLGRKMDVVDAGFNTNFNNGYLYFAKRTY